MGWGVYGRGGGGTLYCYLRHYNSWYWYTLRPYFPDRLSRDFQLDPRSLPVIRDDRWREPDEILIFSRRIVLILVTTVLLHLPLPEVVTGLTNKDLSLKYVGNRPWRERSKEGCWCQTFHTFLLVCPQLQDFNLSFTRGDGRKRSDRVMLRYSCTLVYESKVGSAKSWREISLKSPRRTIPHKFPFFTNPTWVGIESFMTTLVIV